MRRSRPAAALALAALAAASGCAMDLFGVYEPGGADNLPVSGAGPFQKLPFDPEAPADEPWIAVDRGASLTDPCALPVGEPRADGATVRLWFGRAPDAGGSAIGELALVDPGQLPVAGPSVVLAADAPWEAGWIGKPAVLDLGGGRLRLYYQGGDPAAPALGRAESDDGGAIWRKATGNPVLTVAGDPAVIAVDGYERVYVVRPDEPGVWLYERPLPPADARADDGGPLTAVGQVLRPRPTVEDAFDGLALREPGVTADPTLDPDDPLRVALYVTGVRSNGSRDPIGSIGLYASFDGVDFEPAAVDPVLDGKLPDEGGASVVLAPSRALLFFHEAKGGRPAIAVAVED